MTWVEFLGWKRLAHKRSIEQRNQNERSRAGLPPRAPGPDSSEWAEYQRSLAERTAAEAGGGE